MRVALMALATHLIFKKRLTGTQLVEKLLDGHDDGVFLEEIRITKEVILEWKRN